MLEQALIITLFGMGGVFLFLIILIACMQILRLLIPVENQENLNKVALSIALAKHKK